MEGGAEGGTRVLHGTGGTRVAPEDDTEGGTWHRFILDI